MATNQSSFTLSKTERRDIVGLARNAGLSFSNYVRCQLGLEPLKHGGSENAKRARTRHARRKAAEA